MMPPDKCRNFPVPRGDRDDRSAGGGDPVELARHDQAFEFAPQRNQMDVGSAQGELEYASLLIGKEAEHMVEPSLAHRAHKLGKFVAAADKQEAEALLTAKPLSRCKDGFELVAPTEISRIADD